jgi:acyl-CoA synthetase (NDP forming)
MVAAPFKRRGLPVFDGEGEAVAALRQFIGHHELMDRAKSRFGDTPSVSESAGRKAGEGTSLHRLLDEAASLAVLAEAGLPTVPHRLCKDPEEAVAAAASFGGPAVVKGCSPDVAHKSELGLVHLGVSSPDGIRSAFQTCKASLAAHGASFSGVLVAPMAKGRRELLLGAHRDPFFGPVILVGDGGKYVEAMPDTRILLPPFSAEDVREALGRLRIAPLLAGTRGELPIALESYVAAALALARLMTEPGSRIASVDINPFLVGTTNEGGLALDAVVFEHDGRTQA